MALNPSTTQNQRIIFTDPNETIALATGGVNAIPDYETMSPYVEMYAIRKTGVTIVLGANGNYESQGNDTSFQVQGTNSNERVNFLNFDIPSQTYTTNYTGDIVGTPDRDSNEGFGISAISVKMNANYMPMVEATFIDIKAASVIREGDKSPLAALFDFPSPIFKMRLKGAFGKFVEYDLHMTKNDIEINDMGDFIIKASFIGEYFGPLTDVLLGYIKAVPYLKGEETSIEKNDSKTSLLQSGEVTTVNSFFEMVNRGELLYTKISNYESNTTKKKQITEKNVAKDSIGPLKIRIANLNLDRFIKEDLAQYEKDNNVLSGTSLNVLDIVISKVGTETNSMLLSPPIPNPLQLLNSVISENTLISLSKKYLKEKVEDSLSKSFEEIKKNNPNLLAGSFSDYVVVVDTPDSISIDYSKLVTNIPIIENTINIQVNNLTNSIRNDVATIVKNNIDFRPSIRNVFEILLNDFDSFLTIIKSAGQAQKNLGASQFKVDLRKTLIDAPFPEVIKTVTVTNKAGVGLPIQSDVLVYPGTVEEFRNWEEVKLVEAYCKSLISQIQVQQQVENQKIQSSSGGYIPLFPLEYFADPANLSSQYQMLTNVSDLYKAILANYVTIRDFAYGISIDVESGAFSINPDYNATTPQKFAALFDFGSFIISEPDRILFIKSLAKGEARNIANAFAGTNSMAKALLGVTGKKIDFMRGNIIKANIDNNLQTFFFDTQKEKSKTSFGISLNRQGLKRTEFDESGRAKNINHVLYRTDKDFSGLEEILNPATFNDENLYTPKQLDGSPFDQERLDTLTEIGSNLFGVNKAITPIVTKSNTFLFVDDKASKGALNGPSDFTKSSAYDLLMKSIIDNGTFTVPRTASELFSNETFLEGNINSLGGTTKNIYRKFQFPGAVEVPYWFILYTGFKIKENPDAFSANISVSDKEKLLKPWLAFNDGYESFFKSRITDTKKAVDGKPSDKIETIVLNEEWFKELIAKRYIINNSGTTFLNPESITHKSYRRVQLTDDDQTLNLYLDTLFTEVQKKLNEYTKSNEAVISQAESKFSDNDFKLNVYMSFKTIYDRWLAGNDDYAGQSGQKALNPLLDKFKFITRAQQDIGDLSIVDFRNFLDDSKNPESSVFTAISNILSKNQYMFFPLHSFMDFNGGDARQNWESNFKIQTQYSDKTISKPAFVCMYIGSYATKLNVGQTSSNYSSDGFSIHDEENLPVDFSSQAGGNIFAFNVKVGSQNQMVFSSFKASTTEFKNTDISLKIQDEIINKQTETNRIGKAQNLLNIYTQRSYTMGVTIPFGNMCIQPTQYFEITGLPIWNGIYMIHEVTHAISAGTNRLTTEFKGYKLGKATFPIITEFLLDYSGISSEFGDGLSSIASSFDLNVLDKNTIEELKRLEPSYFPVFVEFLASVAADGWKVSIQSGRRSRAEQTTLANKGLGPRPKGGGDVHMNGFAIDCNFTKGNRRLGSSKYSTKEDWLESNIPQKAISLGLIWGGNFIDYPDDFVHFGTKSDGTLNPRTVPVANQGSNTAKYNPADDKGLFLSSKLPYGDADNTRFSEEVRTLAQDLRVSPNALMAAMYLESAFKTTARSKTSSAAGLIQFVANTAKDYTGFYNRSIKPSGKAPLPKDGLTPRIIATLNPFDQLKLVGSFLKSNLQGAGSRNNNFFNISLAIFMPNFQRQPDEKVLFSEKDGNYTPNRVLDVGNKRYVTVGDYKAHILKRIETELGLSALAFQTITA